jgi:hypothetical protein
MTGLEGGRGPGEGPCYRELIDFVKRTVGEGAEYFNDLLRVVLSERGCYYQFHHSPEEFSGALGDAFSHEFMGTARALALFSSVNELAYDPQGDTRLSLLALYPPEPADPEGEDCTYAIHDTAEHAHPHRSGRFRPGVLPVFFKLKVASERVLPLLGASSGIVFFAANLTDRHLLVRIPNTGVGSLDLAGGASLPALH